MSRRAGHLAALAAVLLATVALSGQPRRPAFAVLAFYTGVEDPAHISFVGEANRWFPEIGRAQGFVYDATTDWKRLNADELSRVQVVLFLDTRPEDPAERDAFRHYMEHGGAWMGFHSQGSR